MKRLYSYLMYVGLVGLPIGFIGFAVDANRHFKLTWDYFFSNDLILLIFLAGIFYSYYKLKRVYFMNSSLYIYNIFSNKYEIVNRQNLITVGRFIPFDPLSYKISYVNSKGSTKTIIFMKNLFLFDIKGVFEKLD